MKADEATVRLADEIADRRVSGEQPPALFLGAGVMRAAGAPSVADVGRTVFDQLREDPDADRASIPPPDADDAEVATAFRALLVALEPMERAGLTHHASATFPVSQFLQDLAALIRDGAFATVITTSFDALIERALAGAGLYLDRHYRVVDAGEHSREPEPDTERGMTLVKLHGRTIDGSGALVERALASTVAIVGHETGDPPLLDALAAPGGPIWWVAPEAPPPEDLEAYRQARDLALVTGDAGDPDRFFGELSVLLVQMPAVNILSQSPESLGKTRSVKKRAEAASATKGAGLGTVASAVLAHVGGTEPPEDESEFERQFLQGRLQRAGEALRKLEEEAAGGADDEGLRHQLDYQRHIVIELESGLRELERERERVVELLQDVVTAAKDRGDSGVTTYLSSLVERIATEYERPQPNEDIVAASLGAVMILAERVSLDGSLVRELAGYAPPTHALPS